MVLYILCEGSLYEYPVYRIDGFRWIFHFIVIVIFDLVMLAVYFLNKSLVAKVVCLVLATIFIVWIGFLLFSITRCSIYSCYENDDYTTMDKLDTYLENRFKLADIKLGDILDMDIVSCNDFYYYYTTSIFGGQFQFKGDFVFERDDYERLFSALSEAEEYKLVYEENSAYTGSFELIENYPVDKIEVALMDYTATIRFSDKSNQIFIDLWGDYNS